MNPLSTTIAGGFVHYFEDFSRSVHALAAPLNEQEFWTNPFPFGNSIGNLVLHITGNLNYYVGAQLAGSGYIRNRPREFTVENPPSKDETLQQLATAVQLVLETLRQQNDSDWSLPYHAEGVDDVPDRFNMFLRCAIHFHHHIGQMLYTADELRARRG